MLYVYLDIDDNEMVTAVGVVECHNLLAKAQSVLFDDDIFKHVCTTFNNGFKQLEK
jgi:hypothetical protein